VLLLLGGTTVVGLFLLTTLPPPPNCQQLSQFSADSERLYCAQLAAQSGKLDQLVAAMHMVQYWPEDHPLYSEAQRLMGQWSQAILNLARQKINQGDLKGAIAIANQIPVNSPLYPETKVAIASWQQEWRQGEVITRKFQTALKGKQWQLAWAQLQGLLKLNLKYWNSSKQSQFQQRLAAEKEGWQSLQEAQELAKTNTLEDLEQAIALAGKINPNTYVRAQAQAQRNLWSRTLLQMAAKLFATQDFNGVVAVAQKIPQDVPAYAIAQDWIHLSLAHNSAKKAQVFALLDALSAVEQIPPQSPLYPKAKAKAAFWKFHLEDQIKLQFAHAIASFDQRFTFQLAINEAQQVAPKRPGRGLSQTLIASWRKELQEIEDRAAFANAQQVAQPGTVEQLKTAVLLASQIQQGQPLRIAAQTAIAKWTKQIQTQEDQPILDLARAFAQRGDLIAAIDAAQQIAPKRALYAEAQGAVNEWRTQIQIAEDRPILDAATALAGQGRLDAAIQTAAQIRAGRPLYPEAQKAIARWQEQRQAVFTPAPLPSENPSTPPEEDFQL